MDSNNRFSFFENGQSIVPTFVAPNDGEVSIKQYEFAKLRTLFKFERAKGRLHVTNKRLIFRSVGFSPSGKTTVQQEFAVDDIAGIDYQKNFVFNIVMFILLALLSAAIAFGSLAVLMLSPGIDHVVLYFLILFGIGIEIALFAKFKQFTQMCALKVLLLAFITGVMIRSLFYLGDIIMFLPIILLVACFLFSFTPNLSISIKTKTVAKVINLEADRSISIIGFLLKYNKGIGFAEVLPNDDTDVALREIGSIINELQSLGDLAIEKWKSN